MLYPGVAPHGGLATAEELDAAHAAESRPAPQCPEDYWSPQQVRIAAAQSGDRILQHR